MEKTEESALDAVNTALGDVVIDPETTPADVEEEGLDTEGTSPESDEPEAEGETEETDEEAEARGAVRDPATGKFTKKGEEAPAEGEKPKVEAKKVADPVNDPIPRDLKKETSDRIRTLIDTTKTQTARADKIQQDFDFLIKGVEGTGATPQQYGEALSWLSLFNSREPAQQEKALELVESVAERLATLLGKERTVGDPLSTHSDLKDAVAKGQITAQYAKEIARTRNGQNFRTELTTSATQEQQRQQEAAQELATARARLTELGNTLEASDPSYAAKRDILVPALKAVFASIPPSQWHQKFTEAYRNIKVNVPVAKPKGAPVNQPLRAGKQPAGGQTRAPSSMLEAISGALGSMNK
jgi:hypothetical protein